MIITTSPHSDTIYNIFHFSIFTINDNYNSIIDDTIYYMFHFFQFLKRTNIFWLYGICSISSSLKYPDKPVIQRCKFCCSMTNVIPKQV